MSQNGYNNIKKYAAFIFMVFTVLSGSSERVSSYDFVKVGKKAFIDILTTNKLFIQDSKASVNQLCIKSSAKGNQGFRDFLDTNVDSSGLNYIQADIIRIAVSENSINNAIIKNSIWKNAVF
jgi:hypothetical protein